MVRHSHADEPRSPLGPNGECGKCGQSHMRDGTIRCSGHISTGAKGGPVKPNAGRPCRRHPVSGLSVCRQHGGAAPHAKAAAERRVTEAKIAEAARKLIPDAADRPVINNPLERLLELASEADAFRESLRLIANKLDDQIATGIGDAQLRAEIATYRQALKDTTDMLVAIARLDIEKMLARITLAQAEQALAALRAGMDEADLTGEQQRKVMTSAGRHLRAVTG